MCLMCSGDFIVYREQKEQLQKMKDFGCEPQMADHPPPQDSRLQNASRPTMYPVREKVFSDNEMGTFKCCLIFFPVTRSVNICGRCTFWKNSSNWLFHILGVVKNVAEVALLPRFWGGYQAKWTVWLHVCRIVAFSWWGVSSPLRQG